MAADLHPLLVVTRTVYEPAPREVLQARLTERLQDKEWRLQRYASREWPFSISDRWLQGEIDVLQRALADGVTTLGVPAPRPETPPPAHADGKDKP